MNPVNPMSEAEFALSIEEAKHKCVPSQIGFATTPDHRRIPGLYVEIDLKDHTLYLNADVCTYWTIAQNNGIVCAVFLDFELKGSGINIKVIFDSINIDFIEWLDLLVKTGGELALTDKPTPTVDGISINGVPLDTPLLILQSLKREQPYCNYGKMRMW